jgi:hypothetical protein
MNQYEWLFNETNFKGLAHLFLILYAARLAPELPKAVLDLFTNGYFKLFIYVLILYTANVNPTTALLIAIAFMVTLNVANQKKMFEMMEGEVPTETPAPVAALQALADAAATSTPAPEEKVAEIVEIAQSAVQTQEGTQAIQALAEAAVSPNAAPVEDVAQVAQIAFDSMTEAPVTEAPVTEAPVTEAPVPMMSVSETQTPVPPKVVSAEPAMTPAAQEQKVPEQVEAELPCYPERKYDITKVHPVAAFDNYSEFLLSV